MLCLGSTKWYFKLAADLEKTIPASSCAWHQMLIVLTAGKSPAQTISLLCTADKEASFPQKGFLHCRQVLLYLK